MPHPTFGEPLCSNVGSHLLVTVRGPIWAVPCGANLLCAFLGGIILKGAHHISGMAEALISICFDVLFMLGALGACTILGFFGLSCTLRFLAAESFSIEK